MGMIVSEAQYLMGELALMYARLLVDADTLEDVDIEEIYEDPAILQYTEKWSLK